jgi:uracil DNA glycosylase
MSTNLSLVDTLKLTVRGLSWFRVLPQECIDALFYIESKLDTMWNCSSCYPIKKKTLLPFHMIGPEEVVMVILCKEPYSSSSMATGVPVETGGRLHTLSEQIFMQLISKYWTGVTHDNFMRCYYASGILVINSSFTVEQVHDKKYSLTQSHFPLWTTFCHPLVKYLNSLNINILGLGVEAKGLLRNMANGSRVHNCPFPTDSKSIREFLDTTSSLIDTLIFNTHKH